MLAKHQPQPVLYRYSVMKTDGSGQGCELNAKNPYYALKRAVALLKLPKDYKGQVTVQCLGKATSESTVPKPTKNHVFSESGGWYYCTNCGTGAGSPDSKKPCPGRK